MMRLRGNRTLKTWVAASAAICALGTLSATLAWKWVDSRAAQAPTGGSALEAGAAIRADGQDTGDRSMKKSPYELLVGRKETADAPFYLVVTLKNNSRESIFFVDSDPLKDHRLEVKDERGNVAPLSKKGAKILDSGWTHRVVRELKPGEQTVSEIDLGQLYDLPGGVSYM